MRYAIDTAPKDGKVVILEDDASGTYDVAHWSAEAGDWIGESGEPSKIIPTHWYAMPGDKYIPEDNRPSGSSQVGSSASRVRDYFFPLFNFSRFFSNKSAPRRPAATSDVIARCPPTNTVPMTATAGVQTALDKAKRAAHARGRFFAVPIAAVMIGAVLAGMYLFRAEIATRYTGYLDIARSGTIGGKVVDQENQLQDSRRIDTVARDFAVLQQQAEADRTNTQAAVQEVAEVKHAAEASVLEAQSLEKERRRAATLANELSEARRSIDTRDLKLRELVSELATARREIGAYAALSSKAGDEAVQLKQAMESAAEKSQQSLQKERSRAEALERDLELARREIETYAALSSKAADEAVQLKQAAESTTAEMRQSLQRERSRADALERDLEFARRTADPLQPAASSPAAQMVAAEQHTATEVRTSPEAARLIARASALLRQGDIGAARIVLERAAEAGSAQASFTLAETYDPVILSTWGTYGTRGDPTKAREFYANAYAGGIQEAKDRFNALRQ